MKADSQNLSLKPWQRFSSMTLWIAGGLVVLTLGRVFFNLLNQNAATAEQEFALLADIAETRPAPSESPYVYFVKETSFGSPRSVLYVKGVRGEGVVVMLDAKAEPLLKVSPNDEAFFLTRTQLESIGKNHEVSAEVWRYLKQHVLPREDESR
jgi:hypothetical protein